MIEITAFKDILARIENDELAMFYLTRPGCGVCSALKPKVLALIERFPKLSSYSVNLDAVPEAGGQLSIFTIPGVLVFAEGKEAIREARYISMDQLEDRFGRLYQMMFPEG